MNLTLLFAIVLCVFVSATQAANRDLYEILGVSSSATPNEIRRIYRKLALKYHPDKHTPEKRKLMEEEFNDIARAFKVLSNPERRAKYDSHGIVNEEEFKNFKEDVPDARPSVEDTPANWLALGLLLVFIMIPVYMAMTKTKKTKPVNRQREALLEARRNKTSARQRKTATKEPEGEPDK